MLRDLIRRRDKACANISVVPSRIMKIYNMELRIIHLKNAESFVV